MKKNNKNTNVTLNIAAHTHTLLNSFLFLLIRKPHRRVINKTSILRQQQIDTLIAHMSASLFCGSVFSFERFRRRRRRRRRLRLFSFHSIYSNFVFVHKPLDMR